MKNIGNGKSVYKLCRIHILLHHTNTPRAAPPAYLLKGILCDFQTSSAQESKRNAVFAYWLWEVERNREKLTVLWKCNHKKKSVFRRLGSRGFETARLISCLTHTGQHGWLISVIDSLERCSRHRLSRDQHAETHRHSYMYDLTCALWSACFKRSGEN